MGNVLLAASLNENLQEIINKLSELRRTESAGSKDYL